MSESAESCEPRLRHVQCLDARGLHRMAYWEWGAPDNPKVLVCVHGLSRQGRDFDTLARALEADYRVVCPDIVGRGRSDWLADPSAYQVPTYLADIVTLLARLNAGELHYLGTSMGGLIGIALASLGDTPIARLVLNDVGPTIEPAAIARIAGYVGRPARWSSIDEAADHLQAISESFGPHSREAWRALTVHMLVADDDASGPGFKLHYDPAIAVAFKAATPQALAIGEAMLWAAYDRIEAPTLLLRGAVSDLLSPATADAMTQRGPRARLHEFAGVGHAPTFVARDQIDTVREFLLGS